MCQNANIQVRLTIRTDKRAGNTYEIETSVTYDPVRMYVEITFGISQQGFTGQMPGYSYENQHCAASSADQILAIIEPEDLVWSQAVAVARGNRNAKQILDGQLDHLLSGLHQTDQ